MTNEGTKVCRICGMEKSLSEFHRREKPRKDVRGECKSCYIISKTAYFNTEAGKVAKRRANATPASRAAQKKWLATPKGKACAKKSRTSEHGRAVQRAYAKTDVAKRNQRKHRFTEKGKITRRKSTQKYRALKNAATFEYVDEKKVFDFCGNKCAYCSGTENLTQEHIVPISKGGAHCESNLLVACQSCNSSKGNKPVAEWLATRPMTISKSLAVIGHQL